MMPKARRQLLERIRRTPGAHHWFGRMGVDPRTVIAFDDIVEDLFRLELDGHIYVTQTVVDNTRKEVHDIALVIETNISAD
jgi:hypothetical protein